MDAKETMQPIVDILNEGLNEFIREKLPDFPTLVVVPTFPEDGKCVLDVELDSELVDQPDPELLEQVLAESHLWVEWAMGELSGNPEPGREARARLAEEFSQTVEVKLNSVVQRARPGFPHLKIVSNQKDDMLYFFVHLAEDLTEDFDSGDVANVLDMAQFWVDKTVKYAEARASARPDLSEEEEMELHYSGLCFMLEKRLTERIEEVYPDFPKVTVSTVLDEDNGRTFDLTVDASENLDPSLLSTALFDIATWLDEDLEKMVEFFGDEN